MRTREMGGNDNFFDHLKRQEIKMEEIWRRDKRRELEKRREAEFTKILLLQAMQKRLLLALASSPLGWLSSNGGVP